MKFEEIDCIRKKLEMEELRHQNEKALRDVYIFEHTMLNFLMNSMRRFNNKSRRGCRNREREMKPIEHNYVAMNHQAQLHEPHIIVY
jgi:hypothetical protein